VLNEPQCDDSDLDDRAPHAERENELLTNVCAWFEEADLDHDANRRVIDYLRDRYTPALHPAVAEYIEGRVGKLCSRDSSKGESCACTAHESSVE
jgi:hypothetical protein